MLGRGETRARRPENTRQLRASGHSPGRMQECPSYSGDKRAGTDGKHLSERGTMAGWLTGWHFSLSCAGFGPESPAFFCLADYLPGAKLPIRSLLERAASVMQTSLVTCSVLKV